MIWKIFKVENVFLISISTFINFEIQDMINVDKKDTDTKGVVNVVVLDDDV